MGKKNYYDILGVSRNADEDTIKKAYRKLAMQYHPDRNPGKEAWANEKFKEINEAFSVLGDPQKRKQYDQFGTVGNIGDIFGSTSTRTTFEDLMQDFGGSGLGFDFLENIFGDFRGGRGSSFKRFSRGAGRPRGIHVEAPGGINLEEIFGQGQRSSNRAVRYELIITKEQATQGLDKKLTRKGKTLNVKIPAGVKNGARVRLRNARQITDGQPGDIIILVKVK
ncbi:DnaJ domain-containing protein [Chloroflexota bacterium]